MKNKLITVLLIIVTMLGAVIPVSANVNIGQDIFLEGIGECDRNVKYGNTLIQCTYVVYNINGIQYPAYCVERTKLGIDDDTPNVTATITGMIDNNRIWRTVINGYPYKTPEQLGVADKYEAFLATKQAIYRAIDNNGVDAYSGTNSDGDRVVRAIRQIYEAGLYGTQTRQTPLVNVTSNTGKATLDTQDSNYLSKVYNVTSNYNIKSYTVNIDNAPEETYIADINNNAKTIFSTGESFKVYIPTGSMENEGNFNISVTGNLETKPLFYGFTADDNFQDYLLTYDHFEDVENIVNLEYEGHPYITILKTEAETEKPIEGVTFKLEDKDHNLIGEYTTNDKGEIIIKDKLSEGKYYITETKTPDIYALDKRPHEVFLKWNENTNIHISNEFLKLGISIEKTGIRETQGNDVIRYNFSNIENKSNVPLDNFYWLDNLPKEVRLEKVFTGIWNEKLAYKVLYRTNMNSEYILLKDMLDTEVVHEIDFRAETLGLREGEYVTGYKFEFGTVKAGFKEAEAPFIFVKVVDGLNNGHIFTNNTSVHGKYLNKEIEAFDKWNTVIYNKTLKLTELPKTGI